MFQAETESDFEDWTEAMTVLIEKIEKKNRIQIKDVDVEGKNLLRHLFLGFSSSVHLVLEFKVQVKFFINVGGYSSHSI